MKNVKLGLALCGSYCTYERVLAEAAALAEEYEVTALMSETAAETDSRFGTAEGFLERLEEMTGKAVIRTITGAERVGPERLFDVLVIAPCTGNTLAKLALSITDTPVTMAVKSHLRAEKPVVLCPATNDALRGSAKNIGALLNGKNCYFVPFRQDNPKKKPASLVADFDCVPQALEAALHGSQLQPVLV